LVAARASRLTAATASIDGDSLTIATASGLTGASTDSDLADLGSNELLLLTTTGGGNNATIAVVARAAARTGLTRRLNQDRLQRLTSRGQKNTTSTSWDRGRRSSRGSTASVAHIGSRETTSTSTGSRVLVSRGSQQSLTQSRVTTGSGRQISLALGGVLFSSYESHREDQSQNNELHFLFMDVCTH